MLVEYYKTVQSQIHVHKVYGTQLWSVHVCQNMEGSNIFRLKTHKWNSPTSSWWVSKVRGQVRDSFPNFCNWCTWKHPTRFTELALSAAELHGTIFPLWKYAHFAPVVLGLASGYYKGRACRPPDERFRQVSGNRGWETLWSQCHRTLCYLRIIHPTHLNTACDLCFMEKMPGTEAKASQTTADIVPNMSGRKGICSALELRVFPTTRPRVWLLSSCISLSKYVFLFFFSFNSGPGCLMQSSFLHEEWVVSLCI